MSGRALCVVAEAGAGKSSVALDVGARLWRAGRIPAGTLRLDLREARTVDGVAACFCAVLGVAQVRTSGAEVRFL